MARKRKVYYRVLNHVYQRTVNGVHLFYSEEDRLVFYSILSVCAKGCNVQIIKVCLMHNHMHLLIEADSLEELSSFMDRATSWFVRTYNIEHGRTGRLLKKNYGSAPKWEEKKQRSAIIYVGNNPVEKGFCPYAENYRWNFLAYAKSTSPFSEPLVIRSASAHLKKALKIVDNIIALNLSLKYSMLRSLKAKLSPKEYEQLIDYIIVGYQLIDYNALISRFKSYDDMIYAMHSTTGDEFDIKEGQDDFSLRSYKEMMEYLHRTHTDEYIRKMISLPLEEKMQLASILRINTTASIHQIAKFLHISITKR